jgi:hypothetical protein
MSKHDEAVTLSCCRCGKESAPVTGRPITCSFDLLNAAEHVGFIGEADMHRGRVLVFCSKECDDLSKYKNGFYKSRLRKRAGKTDAKVDE